VQRHRTQCGESDIDPRRTRDERIRLLRALEKRDSHLWALTLIVLLALGAFVSAVSLWKEHGPAVAGGNEWSRAVFLLGFVGLTLLFCAHVAFQHTLIRRLRRQLLMEDSRQQALDLEVSELESAVANMASDRDRSRVKSEFVSAVSHQLRTPLTNIRNSIDAVLQGRAGDLSGEQGRFLGVAGREVDRLARLIDQLLDLSKMESGRAQFKFESVDMVELAGEAVKGCMAAAENKSIRVTLETGGEVLKARADRERIRQVIDNLLGNAVDFTPEGGAVRVRVEPVADREKQGLAEKARFHPSPREHYVQVSVEDGGAEHPEDDPETDFERFLGPDDPNAQNAQTAQETPGNGLSLVVARDVVRAHEGAIWAERRPERGAVFRFVLPTKGTSAERLESVRLIGDAMERARKLNEPFCLVILRVLPLDDVPPQEGEVRAQALLEETAGIGQRSIRGSDTLAVHPSLGEVHLFLARTGEQGGRIVSERAGCMIGQFRSDHPELLECHRIEVGFASFPDDAMSAVEIEEIAREAAEMPVAAS
jgi:signal transduction histidine kinase